MGFQRMRTHQQKLEAISKPWCDEKADRFPLTKSPKCSDLHESKECLRADTIGACKERGAYHTWTMKHPSALKMFDQMMSGARKKRIAVFLDYDGTLSPIVDEPDRAFMSDAMRAAVCDVAQHFPTAIISGRCRDKVYDFVQLPDVYYAGSHGMDIMVPSRHPTNCDNGDTKLGNEEVVFQPAKEFLPKIEEIYKVLDERTMKIRGVLIENNKFCLSVHFRRVNEKDWSTLEGLVKDVLKDYPNFRLTWGRKVMEIRPCIKWDKGCALEYLLDTLGFGTDTDVLPFYLGDDRTDEDAFKVLERREQGFPIIVSSIPRDTKASHSLRDPSESSTSLVEWYCNKLTKKCTGYTSYVLQFRLSMGFQRMRTHQQKLEAISKPWCDEKADRFPLTKSPKCSDLHESKECLRADTIWASKEVGAYHTWTMMSGAKKKRIAVFLDNDGTLSPIMRAAVRDVAQHFSTAIISRRCRDKVYDFVQLPDVYYVGSHGMDIMVPSRHPTNCDNGDTKLGNEEVVFQPAKEFLPKIEEVANLLDERTMKIRGVLIENNKFCLSVHFRRVNEKQGLCMTDTTSDVQDWSTLEGLVKDVLQDYPNFRLTWGRKIRPCIKWDKGCALEYLLDTLGFGTDTDVLPFYLGDDRTDEDAFKVPKEAKAGFPIIVSSIPGYQSFSLPPRSIRGYVVLIAVSEVGKNSAANNSFGN
ncbi:hypothetical protein H6P81_014438 [Aristolochia fimbriata]|uniref:trehalose-phosphatase n=1 Tax=Aristolochia fimbriata TaxID=158543 RepID=A0AAV7EHI7_ARIFI|nr:hypothetical protein H6P81_014438 [Aristolochia fimbriata]